jgi:DNA replication and repair protein RecF
MARVRLTSLTLTDFRSYERAELACGAGTVFLYGPNGAGKTNLLEAVSLLSPGKGLRGSSVSELGRRAPGEAAGKAWSVSLVFDSDGGETRIGTGIEAPGASRRIVRMDGETVPPGRLAEHLRLVWLTPAQDRLFLEGASDRRKFLDRLVFAAEPAHAGRVAAYEKAMRERMRLLTDEAPADPAWLSALEAQAAAAGAEMAAARTRGAAALQAEIDSRTDRPFPRARVELSGDWERLAAKETPEMVQVRLVRALAEARARDAGAGRALTGPHRGDLLVTHAEKGRAAAECSTGEQKALILNLVLAQAARLSREKSQPNPILLLDEVAAHLDADRRGGLFDELEALGLQAFLTGVEEGLFTGLRGRALGVRVDAGQLTILDNG